MLRCLLRFKETSIMTDALTILAFSKNIEDAFKSMIKSGRPDITDDQNNSLISDIYVDLYENDYVLRQVMDDNHTLLKGRKGTGKSTIFLQAEQKLSKSKDKVCVYINLQSIYEEIRTANSEVNEDLFRQYQTYINFFTEIVTSLTNHLKYKIKADELNQLIKDIEQGKYIDIDFLKSVEITNVSQTERQKSIHGIFNRKDNRKEAQIEAGIAGQNSTTETRSHKTNEFRTFSIHKIMGKIKTLLEKRGIKYVYLFLDDFSELNLDKQKIVMDSLVAPIISSYNTFFKVKIAAYPSRIYLGNIDSTKVLTHSLDFYDVYEKSANNYLGVEELAMDYVERTLRKRVEVFTQNQMQLEEIFDTSKIPFCEYIKTLFYCSAGIPRSLGYILTYCYLSTINQGKLITIASIENATEKYYTDNILPDFFNDVRYKQSFYDDKTLLDQFTQKYLVDQIVKKMQSIKRDTIEAYSKNQVKNKIFIETLEKNKKTTGYWFPTSHFYIDKDLEPFLKTLELYFIVNKFNEGSSRDPNKKVSTYGLNYGLCLAKKIDYGRPMLRRSYDYWRQEIFDLSVYIPAAISGVEFRYCTNCGKQYTDDLEYSMYEKYHRCLSCGQENCVVSQKKFGNSIENKIKTWKEQSLPNHHIDILRLLYNHKGEKLSAYEIGQQIDRHHLSITKSMEKLKTLDYIGYITNGKRYYYITDKAIRTFFSDEVDLVIG